MFNIKKTFKNEKLLLKFAKKDLSKVPYYELAECLEKNKITISFAKKQFSKYPIVKQLIPILNNKISELDLKIFEGELQFGQDIKYFEEYYNTKRSSQSKSSSGTRTELIAEGVSNKINREVQALILKFEYHLVQVLKNVNRFYEKDWSDFRTTVEQLSLNPFKNYKKIE